MIYFAVRELHLPYGTWKGYVATEDRDGIHIRPICNFTRDLYCCGTWVVGNIKSSPGEVNELFDALFHEAERQHIAWPTTVVGWTSTLESELPSDWAMASWKILMTSVGSYHDGTIFLFAKKYARSLDYAPDIYKMPWVMIPENEGEYPKILSHLKRHASRYISEMEEKHPIKKCNISVHSMGDHWGFYTTSIQHTLGNEDKPSDYTSSYGWQISAPDFKEYEAVCHDPEDEDSDNGDW